MQTETIEKTETFSCTASEHAILQTIEGVECMLFGATSPYTGLEAWFKAFVQSAAFDKLDSAERARAFDYFIGTNDILTALRDAE